MMIFGCNALALQPFLLLMIDLLRRKPHESVASAIPSCGFRHTLLWLPPHHREASATEQCTCRDTVRGQRYRTSRYIWSFGKYA